MLSLRTFGEDICKQPASKKAEEAKAEEEVEEVKDDGEVDDGAAFAAKAAGVEFDEESAANA
jgi:hypothetical protein